MKKYFFLISLAFLSIVTLLLFAQNTVQQNLRSSAAGTETTLYAYTTAYTYYDNTPPGSADISHPILHQKAGGTGTYTDPITIAVGHTLTGGNDILDFPAGTKFYIPNVRRYFIVEDTCGDGNTPQNGPCHTGYPSGASAWIDMWIDGQSGSNSAADACANKVTDVFLVVKDPGPQYVVVPGAVFTNGACTQLYGNTLVTSSGSTPTPTPTKSPTITPTKTPTPQPTGSTKLSLAILLHGIGNGGDSANPQSVGNQNPVRQQRQIEVGIYNLQNQLVTTKQITVSFSQTTGSFTGLVDLGTTFTSGVYSVKIKAENSLRAVTPGIQTITAGQTNTLVATPLIIGDITGDNNLNILDYEIVLECYSDFLPAAPTCTSAKKLAADLTDDGNVNQADYNLFIRELSNRQGQ